jgi:hypothetical protein
MSETYLDNFIGFIFKFLKFALLIFTGAFIIVGTLWIIMCIFEWIYIFGLYIKDRLIGEDTSNFKKLNYNYSNSSVRCPNCHLVVPNGPRCNICDIKLPGNLKLIGHKNEKKSSEDETDISTEQYSTRKKYQKIKCPYCNSLSKLIKEDYLGSQTRRCRNNHIFVYNYESEMLIQNELNAKYK